MMKTHIALLRGINVGGHKKLPMADLRRFIESLGFSDARTLLQSGNLVFRSDVERDDAALETFLDEQAVKHLGLSTKFLVRSAPDWTQIIARNPFPEAAQTHPARLLTMFFRTPPTAEAIQSLRAVMLASERIHPDGRHLYASLPAGIGDSKMANALMSPRFSQEATGRNWNTILNLATLAGV